LPLSHEGKVKKLLLVLSVMWVGNNWALNVGARKTRKMGITIAAIGNDTKHLRDLCDTIDNDLSFPGQFITNNVRLLKLNSKKEILLHQAKGPLLLTVTDNAKDNCIEWRLYNTRSAKVVAGKKMVKKGKSAYGWGHALADRVLETLTQNEGFFSSKLVYCKEHEKEKNKTQICISDFDGKHEKVIVDPKTLAIAPRWNGNIVSPMVLYSEYTASNMRLMSTDLKGKQQVATSFDGLNMLPAFSDDGKEVILCLSVEGSSQLYRYSYNKRKKRPEYIRLTHNTGSNLSPVVLSNGRIAFCSDFETKRPQIYVMDKKGNNLVRISQDGCCTSPSYSAAKNKIAYSKLIGGVSQILVYDLDTEQTEQVTKDLAHKEESSWSPCGNYLVFSVSDTKTKRLAVHNLLTNKRRFITGSAHRYSYPSWSPCYLLFPATA
jgi:TolB protein